MFVTFSKEVFFVVLFYVVIAWLIFDIRVRINKIRFIEDLKNTEFVVDTAV